MNQMTVTALLWGNEGTHMVPIHNNPEQSSTLENERKGSDRKRSSLRTDNISSGAMKDLILGACLCNNATKQASQADGANSAIGNQVLAATGNETSSKKAQLVGDAADVALYQLCDTKFSVDIEQVKKVNPRINAVPFNSKNKFMITANILEPTSIGNDEDATVLVTLKGAPDFILSRCATYKQDCDDETVPVSDEFLRSVQQRQEELGRAGYRVIAMLQQTFSKRRYDQLMNAYRVSKQQRQEQQPSQMISEEYDLNGLPTNDYCFIGR